MSVRMQLLLVPFLLLVFIGYLSTYVVRETEQVIITKFGQIVGDPVTEPGLYFKIPFVHEVNRLEKRFLPWDGRPESMLTKKQQYLIIDTYARWRISDPEKYFRRLRELRRAISRLDDILGAETKNAVANHELIQIFRSDPGRALDSNQSSSGRLEDSPSPDEFMAGRNEIQKEIFL